jgi:dTDP-4-dehydrorhamnose reductase
MFDLTDCNAVLKRFQHDSPCLLLHCAAMTNTTECEQHPAQAQRINVDVSRFLADLFAEGRMVFFSTDLVFDGTTGCYREEDPCNPLNSYARTKVEAEEGVLAHANHLVIRTSLNGGVSRAGNRGFNEMLELAWKQGRGTSLFVDEFRCPIPATVTARATWELALSDACGICNVAGAQRLSRWEIGQLVAARHPELRPKIEPASLQDYHGPPRAADVSLNCNKAQKFLSFKLPGLAEWLEANPDAPF